MDKIHLIKKFIENQRSMHLYVWLQKSFERVFLRMSDELFERITKNLYIISLDHKALWQAMHFDRPDWPFKIVEIIYHENMPEEIMDYIVAHELWHVNIGYLFPKDWESWDDLENKADEFAAFLWFWEPKSYNRWCEDRF